MDDTNNERGYGMTTFTSWDAELYHHGIKGQKWGIRRFQKSDGTLTSAGIARYHHSVGDIVRGVRKNGTSNSNATPEKLGYVPVKGRKGSGVQRDLARTQMAAERKAAKYSYKASQSDSKKKAKYAEKAKRFVDKAEITRAMQKRYNDLGPYEQRKIDMARKSELMGQLLFGAIGGIAGSMLYRSQLSKLAANTAVDMKRNPKKYRD